MSKKSILLLLSWRDFQHPQSGGAEVFTTEMLSRCQMKKKYSIIHFSTRVDGISTVTKKDNIIYIKKGNCISVIFYAILFYFSNRARIDKVIDQCNTHRFFTPFWVAKNKRVLFIHQFTREIWATKFPWPLNLIGEWLEDPMISIYKNDYSLTVSESTLNDLKSVGFDKNKVTIVPEGVSHAPTPLPLKTKCEDIILYVGRYSEYKGLPDAIEAFVKYLEVEPHAQFVIIGSKNEKYIESELKPICQKNEVCLVSEYSNTNRRSITLLGRVPEQTKLEYMERAKILLYPSQREGWGLGVTEAGILGTPSIVYNSAGLVDAVNKGEAGYLCRQNTPEEIFLRLVEIKENDSGYEEVRLRAYRYSCLFEWDKTAEAFDKFIEERSVA